MGPSVHRKYIPIYIQQDATLHILFISGNCSACFGWYFHPLSGAHTTVSTASGICHTVTAICRCRGRVVCAPDDGWKYYPKHVEQFPDINKLCNVASCWIYEYTGILLGAHYIPHISRIRVKNLWLIYKIKGCASWMQYVKIQQIKLTFMPQNCHCLCEGPIPHPEES